MDIVLQKFIADSGLCSRRQAEELIRSGKVSVNGKPAELGMRVSEADKVIVRGKQINQNQTHIYIKLNKPVGYACTNARVRNEKNVFDLVKTKERLFAVGRLDKDSRGLLLLTNDGDLALRLAHPRYEHEKKYEVSVQPPRPSGEGRGEGGRNRDKQVIIKTFDKINKEKINFICKRFITGIDIGEGDGVVKAKSIRYLRNGTFEIVLTYGKKRQIRRMFKKLGFEVTDLLRTEIAGLKLGSLREGVWQKLNDSEIKKSFHNSKLEIKN
jgi:23S rRNA pseudouridine2604 synthase